MLFIYFRRIGTYLNRVNIYLLEILYRLILIFTAKRSYQSHFTCRSARNRRRDFHLWINSPCSNQSIAFARKKTKSLCLYKKFELNVIKTWSKYNLLDLALVPFGFARQRIYSFTSLGHVQLRKIRAFTLKAFNEALLWITMFCGELFPSSAYLNNQFGPQEIQ